jgi:predicted enzyme related to lactoylglutathione lyase
MSDSTKALPGSIAWIDLTVSDADNVRKFYEAVAGWETNSDYTMSPSGRGLVRAL